MSLTETQIREKSAALPKLHTGEVAGLFVYFVGNCPQCGEPLGLHAVGGKLGFHGWNAYHILTDRRQCSK